MSQVGSTADRMFREKAKLEQLGRRVVEMRIIARREAARKRDIVQCVFDHINASASELQERLREIMDRTDLLDLDTQVQAEIERMRS